MKGETELKSDCINGLQLSAFLDGELLPQEMQAVRFHLTLCERCRTQLMIIQQTDQRMKAMPVIETSRQFERNVWEKIHSMVEKQQNRSIKKWLPSPYKLISATAMAAVLLAIVFLWNRAPRHNSLEEITIAENLELFQNFQEIDYLELLENWEVITSVDEPS